MITLNVALDTDNRRYTISDVTLGDPQQQLRISGARSGNNITIIDKKHLYDFAYSLPAK